MESSINMELNNPVFVYGSLLHGLVNHRLIEDSQDHFQFGGTYFTKNKYLMVSMGAFPGVNSHINYMNSRYSKNAGCIIGELYWASDQGKVLLDHLEGHPDFYRRISIPIRELTHITARENAGSKVTVSKRMLPKTQNYFAYDSNNSSPTVYAEMYELNKQAFFSEEDPIVPNTWVTQKGENLDAISWPEFLEKASG